jgi:transcriptional regulator with XRE-family HTH domain
MSKAELRIKEICKEKGITQAELAKKLGVLPVSFSQSMSRSNFNVGRLSEIADALNVEVSDLFKKASNNTISIVCPNCKKNINIKIE